MLLLFMKGAQGNHIRCVETLLKNNADPNLVDKDGNTALHLGAHGGFVDVVLLLLKGGAMVNAPNKVSILKIPARYK